MYNLLIGAGFMFATDAIGVGGIFLALKKKSPE